ncbi:MAG: GWxTD domain-containing protein [Gemmatimonadales bacterium]
MQRWLLLAGLLIAGTETASARDQIAPALDVRAFRFYRADGGETLVTGLIEIPYRLLHPENGKLAGDISVSVRDSAGLELHRSAWTVRALPAANAAATVLEVVEFKLAAGRYNLEVTLHDSAGQPVTATVPISAYRQAPPASDVVLSPSMRIPEAGDTVLAPGERRVSGVILTPAANLRLTPVRSHLFYMLEVYPGRDTALAMSAEVKDDSGRVVVSTPPRTVRIATGGSVLRGQVDLLGLPAGEYQMVVRLDRGGQVEERTEAFTMADFAETMAAEKGRLAALRGTDEGYFGLMNEDQLNEAEAPLVYLTRSDSLAVWKSGLSLTGKRQFLTTFWAARDPSPGTSRNEAREAFYQRIAEANRRFTEIGRTKVPGWRTARGRISIINGEPTDVLDRRVASGTAPPYLVWRYDRGKPRYYILADRTGFGSYQLIASNDLRETGLPGYREILGAEALQDVSRWLGLDLFQNDRGTSAN